MGIFGPSEKELQLEAELESTQAELGETKKELSRTQDSERRLLDVANKDAGTIQDLRDTVERTTTANTIAAYVIQVLEKMEASDEIRIAAETDARAVVRQRVIDESTASLTNELLTNEYARLVAEIDPATIDTIRRQLTDTFTHDGTFEKTKAQVELDMRAKIITELLAAAKAEATASFATPEAKASLQAEIETLPDFAQKVADIKKKAHEKALAAQLSEFREAAPAIAEEVVERGRDAALQEYMTKWRDSYDGQDMLARLRKKLAKSVAEQGTEQILAQTQDEILKGLYAEREAQIARDLAAEILLNNFTDGGIDTTTIAAGSRLELTLGDTVEKDDTYYDPNYGGNRHGVIKIINEKRRLNLTAQGAGKFIVNYDSLAESKSVYEQNDAIPVGTVLRLGRQQIELNAITLDDRIVYGVPIFYDTDDTDTKITSTELKVRAVKLNHTLAVKTGVKKISHFDGTTEAIETKK